MPVDAAALARCATWVDRNGSRIHANPIKSGVASAAAEDRLAPTHPSSSKTRQATPLVGALDADSLQTSTGFEKVGEWMDPSCTVWARMEFAEPNPRVAWPHMPLRVTNSSVPSCPTSSTTAEPPTRRLRTRPPRIPPPRGALCFWLRRRARALRLALRRVRARAVAQFRRIPALTC